ncbi:MAG: hypothetical protein GXY70_01310 [Euryarchaeota archaeon]|nr:hypothetical protein [Euryarchaeota archaeon]
MGSYLPNWQGRSVRGTLAASLAIAHLFLDFERSCMTSPALKCDTGCISPEERKKILSKFNSLLFWVGETIPSTITVDGEDIPLRDVVFKFITSPCPCDETIHAAHELASELECMARAMQEDLSVKKVDRDRAYEIMHEALGLLRAVDQLRNIKRDECELKARATLSRVNDERRWMEFVRKITI